jgi:hypothetical protein
VGGGEHDKNAKVPEDNHFRIAVKHSTVMSLTQEWNADDGGDERITNKLTPWRWVLLEKPPVAQLHKNSQKFYVTRIFIIVFPSHLSLT